MDESQYKLPFSFAKEHGVLLTQGDDDNVEVIYHGEPDFGIFNEVRRFTGKYMVLKQISKPDFQKQMTEIYDVSRDATQAVADDVEQALEFDDVLEELSDTQELLDSADDAPIIRLLNVLFSQAIQLQASDIHLENFEEGLEVRFRIDGRLKQMLKLQRAIAPLVTSRVKVMARLDIAEKRLPQDGRISLRIAGRSVDSRVSTMPTSHGERVVLRILDRDQSRLELKHLGMNDETLTIVEDLIKRPHGIILMTGPTGSGKTTSLYAMLSELNQPERNILTVEDPIEYDLPGVGQTQVNAKVDMSFARGLRAILRQDPDVVMVGEIRDLETAKVAVQASLTGHLVLSTLHTNSAIGAITRLRDMGVDAFLLSSSLIGTAAQRLVRLLCDACKEAYDADETEKKILSPSSNHVMRLYRPIGCDACDHSGYQGRSGIYEVIAITEVLKQMIHDDASEQDLLAEARKATPSMQADGFRLVLNGQTSLEEILRVTGNERLSL